MAAPLLLGPPNLVFVSREQQGAACAYASRQVPVAASQVPPASAQLSAELGAEASLASLGSLGELAELFEDAADPPSEACAIDIVVNAGAV